MITDLCLYFSEAFVAVAIGSFLLKPEYYRAWWKFARLAIPLAVLFLILINLQIFHTNPGGSGGMGDIYNMLFDQLYIFVVYSLFILGSIITVYLAWRKTKKLNAKSK